MRMEIENKNVINCNELLDVIASCEDPTLLTELLKELSVHTSMKNINEFQARLLLKTIDSRLKRLSNELQNNPNYERQQKNSKILKMLPPTSVSSRAALVNVVLLSAGIIATVILYTLLYVFRVAR